jgi:hypothetical protein
MPWVIGGYPAWLYPTQHVLRDGFVKCAEAARRPPRVRLDSKLLAYQVLADEQAPVPAGVQANVSVPLLLASVKFAVSVGETATIW